MPNLKRNHEERELSRLKEMMKDPRYWKSKDPSYVESVRQGFADLYDEPSSRALAREGEGEAANEIGLNGPRHGQDKDLAHLAPGEIVVPLSAQTAEVLNTLYSTMGDRMAHYVVGSGYEQKNPTSGLPSFADKQNWFEKLADKATGWHFEERDDLNKPLPKTEDEARNSGFQKYPDGMSKYHQNDVGKKERKLGHPDGREVIFDGDSGKVVTDPKLRGTFNYVHQELPPKGITDIIGLGKFLGSGIGHGITDILPWKFGGNVRGAE